MIKIPPEALEAGVKAFAEAEANDYTSHAEDLATAFRAMLEAWEGASHEQDQLGGNWHRLILPLPQEENND